MKNKSKIARTPKLSMTQDTFVRTTGKAIVAASVVGVALLGTVTPAAASPAPKAVKIMDAQTGAEVTAYKFQMPTKNSSIQAGADILDRDCFFMDYCFTCFTCDFCIGNSSCAGHNPE